MLPILNKKQIFLSRSVITALCENIMVFFLLLGLDSLENTTPATNPWTNIPMQLCSYLKKLLLEKI